MRVLLSNDDGVFAPGLQALIKALLASDKITSVKVVAPDSEKSGFAAAVSINKPISVQQVDSKITSTKLIEYAVQGTPADSMFLALHKLYCPQDFDLVITGINSGANMGMDVMLSGTFGAAAIAKTNGVAAIATSLVGAKVKSYRHAKDFENAAKQVLKLIEKDDLIAYLQQQKHQVMNINIPDVDDVKDAVITKLSHLPFKQLVHTVVESSNQQEYGLSLEKNTEVLYSNDKQDLPIDISAVATGHVSISMVGLASIVENNSQLHQLIS